MKLIDLKKGERAKIVAVPIPRMKELGLILGTEINLISKGPFGNPVEISFQGCDLLLDRRTAAKTEVERCD